MFPMEVTIRNIGVGIGLTGWIVEVDCESIKSTKSGKNSGRSEREEKCLRVEKAKHVRIAQPRLVDKVVDDGV